MENIKLPDFFNKVEKIHIPTPQYINVFINKLDKYKFIKDGEYFWAFLFSSEDMVVFVKEDSYYHMAGSWEGRFNSHEFAFIEKINKPSKNKK